MKNSFLNANQRKLLKYGVVLILLVFLVGYYFLNIRNSNETNVIGNNTVSLEGTKLNVFGESYTVKTYPDRVFVHYPFLVIVQADKSLTTVYNLKTKVKEKEINEILIDYYDGNSIWNKDTSYFNNISLGEYCDSAFIKNKEEIYCITNKSRDSYNNMLIKIRPDRPNKWVQVYESDRILTTVTIINDNLYIGEIDPETKQNYLTTNDKSIPVENVGSMIYPLSGVPHFASFQSALNEGKAAYYLIKDDRVIIVNEDKIILYK